MPNGRVASLRSSIGTRLAEVFLGEAIALTANVSHVGRNVEVSLTLRSSDGGIEGPLATTLTNDQGQFFLPLPPGTSADTCRLMVSVGDSGGGTLTRAFVYSTDEAIDIDFISESAVAVVLTRVARGADLCSYSSQNIRSVVDTIRGLSGMVAGNSAAEINQRALEAVAPQLDVMPCIQIVGTDCRLLTPLPTLTVTPTALPTVTPFPAPTPAIIIDTTTAMAGSQTTFNVVLRTAGVSVAGAQNDITFDPEASIVVNAHGKPDCTVNSGIDKDGTAFAVRSANSMRALVLSTNNADTIPDGSVLYTCRVNVAADATGTLRLVVSGVILSTPDGQRVPNATGVDGAIVIEPPH